MPKSLADMVSERRPLAPVVKDELAGLIQKAVRHRHHYELPRFGWSNCGGYLRVSQISDLCPRQTTYGKLTPAPPVSGPLNFESEMMMGMGTLAHSYLQDNVLGPMGVLAGEWVCNDCTFSWDGFYGSCPECAKRLGGKLSIPKYREFTVTNEVLGLQGHVDGLIEINRLKAVADGLPCPKEVKDEEYACLEIKTTNSRAFKIVSGSNELPSYYAMQATLYQLLLGVKKTLFWYIDRDRMGHCSFIYEGDPELEKIAREKIHEVRDALKVGEVLPTTTGVCASIKDSRAKKCPFVEDCFKAGPPPLVGEK